MEIKIKCKQELELKGIEGASTGIVIKKGQSGMAFKHELTNGKYFYSCEVNGHMFDMSQSSFEKHMIESL